MTVTPEKVRALTELLTDAAPALVSDGWDLEDLAQRMLLSGRVDVTVEVPNRASDPAELHRLVEAILGRKVAAVIYEDELPEVEEATGGYLNAGPSATRGATAYIPSYGVGVAMEKAAAFVAIARHIEARDAAAKERERAEEEARAGGIQAIFALLPLSGVVDDDYAFSIARRAYELGARAPQDASRPAWADDEGRGDES